MKKILIIAVAIVTVMIVGGFLSNDDAEFVKGEILVKFKSEVSATGIQSFVEKMQVESLAEFSRVGVQHFKLPKGLKVEDAVEKFRGDPNVEYAEPNYIYSLDATFANDPLFKQLWALHNTGQTGGTPDADIDAPEAWDIEKGSKNIIVGVIDTGIDYNHEDLSGNIWTNPAEIPADGIDNELNGYTDDVRGWNFIDNNNDPMDDHSHGTHVAGTIGALGDNNIGVAGVNWEVSLMPLKFMKPICASMPACGATGSTADAIEAIVYAANNGARVINASWGGTAFSQALKDAIILADSLGVLFVAAAGNDGTNNDVTPHYPSNYGGPPHNVPNVIAVAAIDHNDAKAAFTNFGPTTVHLCAPGVDILSTVPGNKYDTFSGTSMAAPHVAGTAALVMANDPALTHLQVKNKILNCVDPSSSCEGEVTTNGKLNAFQALTCPVPKKEVTTASASIDVSTQQNKSQIHLTKTATSATLLGGDLLTVLPVVNYITIKKRMASEPLMAISYYLYLLMPVGFILLWKVKIKKDQKK